MPQPPLVLEHRFGAECRFAEIDAVQVVGQYLVTGVAAGETYLYVITSDGNLKDSCFVKVTPATGIDQSHYSHNAGIIIYPNPATNTISLVLQTDTEASSIEIMDIPGKVVMHQKVTNKNLSFNIGQLPVGLYFVRLYTNKGIEIHNLIIQ